jgi:O-antigen ligase
VALKTRTGVLALARVVALAGPTALAFFSGGYFDEARAWTGLLAWALALVALVLVPGALPRGRPAALALGGLGLLGLWTLASIAWAPTAGSAYHAGQIDLLYLGALLAAAGLLRGRGVLRALEPALLAGALVVIVYGLSERFVPGAVHLSSSVTAQGRLDQPLSYWNAMGELAAIAFVLAARLAGDASRCAVLRAGAAGAAGPLGLGLYLSFSRGALFAAAAGLLVLIVVSARREALAGAAVCVAAGVLCALAAAPFRGLTALSGALGTREREGAIVLVAVLVVAGLGALGAIFVARRVATGALALPARTPVIALAVVCAGLALAIVLGAKETSRLPSGTSAARFTTLSSDRYDYWRVALRAFARQPVHGVGAGGWAVDWLRYRREQSYAVDAHSLPLQTLAELGLVGIVALAVLLAGVIDAARQALARARPLAAGPVAALVVYLAHSPLDWDWQLPALTLVAVVLAGALLGLAADTRSPAGAQEAAERGALGDGAQPGGRGAQAGNTLAV